MDNQSGTPNGVSDDEIDLMELIANLWDGKWWIAAVTAIFTAAGAGYAFLSPNSVTAEFDFDHILSREEAAYDRLNRLGIYQIDSDHLLQLAMDELRSGQPVIEAARNRLGREPSEVSPEERELAIINLAYSIDAVERGDADNRVTLKWEDRSRVDAAQFLRDIIYLLNSETRNTVTDIFNRRIENEERQKQDRLEDIAAEIEQTVSIYELQTKRRLAFLREQAAIARELGIERNTIEAQTFAASNGVLTSVNTDTPFYLRGYSAIEEEISIISSRQDPLQHADGIIELLAERARIEGDQSLQRARAAFAETPAADETFTAFRQDVNRLEVSSNDRAALITALSLVLGLMVGMFTVLLRTGLRNYRNRRAIAEDPPQ